MTKKIVIGGILAGLAMFIWSSIAHMALPIGEMGVKTISNEDAVIAAMKANITEDGLYFIPGEGMAHAKTLPKDQQQAAMEAWQKKYETGPNGILVYHSVGSKMSMPKLLAVEFAADLIVGLIAAFALAMACATLRSFVGRVVFVTLLGLLGFAAIEVSYWNWYGFPGIYELAQFLDQIIGMVFAGIVLAFVMKRLPEQAGS